MLSVYFTLAAEHLIGGVLFFCIAWLIVRGGVKARFDLLMMGALGTIVLAAGIRFLSIFLVGGEVALNPQGGMLTIYHIAIPVIAASLAAYGVKKLAINKNE